MQIETYRPRVGVHWETGALANILASLGARAPHSGKPYSEAMLLGLGGGVGAGYIHFQMHGGKLQWIFLQLRHSPKYRGEVAEEICARIGVPVEARESSSVKTAALQLEEELDKGRPVFATCAEAGLSHRVLPSDMLKMFVYGVGVFGIEGETAVVDDRSAQPIRISLEELGQARAAIPYNKNRILAFGPPKRSPALSRALPEAIAQCARGLLSRKGLFGLHAFERWRDLLLDAKDKKGWPKAFARGPELRHALVCCFKAIEVDSLAGMRGMYADFLEEAQDVLGERRLADAVRRYRKLSGAWTELAEHLLPPGFPGAHETKQLLRKRRDLHAARGAEAVPEIRRIQAQLDELRHASLELDEIQRHDLLEAVHERLTAICAAERAAAESLKAAVS